MVIVPGGWDINNAYGGQTKRRIAMKKLLVSLVVAGFLAVPMVAQACAITGQIVRLVEYSNVGYIYVKPNPLATTFYYFQTTFPELRAAARTGMETGKPTYISDGAADACASGANNGNVSVIVVNYP
jgi:hypothetical protein